MGRKRKTHEEFIEEVFELVGNSYEVIGDYIGSKTRISMKHVICGYEWEITPNSFLRGTRCPKCAGKVRKDTDYFKSEVKSLVRNTYEVIGDYENTHTRIKMKHNKCGHEFEMKPHDFLRGNRCPKCFGTHKKTTKQFKDEVKQIVGNSYEVVGEYIGSLKRIKMKHNECGYEYEVIPNSFMQGRRCPKCAGKVRKDTNYYKDEIRKLVGDTYCVLGEYINGATRIKMKHNNTSCSNHEFEMKPNSFLSGQRCPSCFGKFKKTTEQFKDEVKKLVGNTYEVLGEYENNCTKISMKHVICNHEFPMRPHNFLGGQRCPKCNESKGEKAISEILDKLNIIYQSQYTFQDCRNKNPLPFDFAIKDKNNDIIALVEYQGEQHYEPVEAWGGEKNLTYVKNNDIIKKKYCEQNNINLIVIPYWEFNNIENIIKEQTKEVYDIT